MVLARGRVVASRLLSTVCSTMADRTGSTLAQPGVEVIVAIVVLAPARGPTSHLAGRKMLQ